MDLLPTIATADVALCAVLALGIMLMRPSTLAHWSLLAGFLLLGAESALIAQSAASRMPEEVVTWQQLRVLVSSLLPCVWLTFSLSYARGNSREFVRRWRWGLILTLVLPVALAGFFRDALVTRAVRGAVVEGWELDLGWPALAINLVQLVSAVLILMNLERTFRASVGTMRWRIKYLVLGLAVVFGSRIYVSSQMLLYRALDLNLVTVSQIGLLIGGLVAGFSLTRSRLLNIDIFPSHAVLHRSLTAALVGTYLLVVGVLARLIVQHAAAGVAFPLLAFVVLLGLVGLSSLLLSDRIRQRTKRFVSRHFRRPLYDYRKVWSDFTERTRSLVDPDSFCRAVVRLWSESFEVLSATLWLVDAERERLVFAASSSLTETAGESLVRQHAGDRELIEALLRHPGPVDMNRSREPWVARLQGLTPDDFGKGGGRLSVPMLSGGELVGVITLGDRVSGVPFSPEDIELAKTLADQVAASLRNIQLSQRLVQAKEMEAFQTMSAFFVHDLKNTASTLSLTLQNMAVHFDDPAFRQDAARALSQSVTHLNRVIEELAVLRQKLEIRRCDTDLSQLVEGCLAAVEGAPGVQLTRDVAPGVRAAVDPDQIRKVVTNLLLNARDAVGPGGQIEVATRRDNRWALISVRDSGCGMSAEFIRQSLFKPFRTTKKRGLGIGMFHSKTLVEAHQGKIEVESQAGQGTLVRVCLPLEPEEGKKTPVARAAAQV